MKLPKTIRELNTPALLLDENILHHNLTTMSTALPGRRLRPHVKAHKCTGLARRQKAAGHAAFTCATLREVEGMIAAGFGDDLLLANQTLEVDRLRRLCGQVLVAVDSAETIDAASQGGVSRVLIEINVGLNRCGCAVAEANGLANLARRRGLEVCGVMGYEGHAAHVLDREARRRITSDAMHLLREAHTQIGGSILSAGSTGTFECNSVATEIQAGSYVLMDTTYALLKLPFRQALTVLATVLSTHNDRIVADCGLKALGMNEGPPTVEGGEILAVHDEHIIFRSHGRHKVGDQIQVFPAHIDPTIAYHECMYLFEYDQVLDKWPIDLRGWTGPSN